MRTVTCLALLSVAACAEPPGYLLCELMDEAAIVSPAEGEFYEPGVNVDFEAAAIEGESNAPRSGEVEVWLVAGVEPTIKIWSSEASSANHRVRFSLADGNFEPGFLALETWRSYAVRVRYRGSKDDCELGPWSEFTGFKIGDGSQALFDDQVIHNIALTIPADSWESIDDEAQPTNSKTPHLRSYYPGTVEFDGMTFVDAGMRIKGGWGSSRHLDEKSSFKINLSDYGTEEDCPESRRVRGLKRLTLNNQVQDGSFVRERLTYELYDLVGVPSARRAPIRLAVNGEHWGLYLHLETVDRRFLKRRYTSAQGMLYEGTYRCDIVADNMPGEFGPATCFSMKFSEECSQENPDGDPYSFAPLRRLSQQIDDLPDDGFYPAVTSIVDFDEYLSLWAADAISGNWDGAVYGDINNYRLYHEPLTDLWSYIPSGVDQTFVAPPAAEDTVVLWEPDSILAKRCLEEDDCEAAFAARLREVLTIYDGANFSELAIQMADQVRDEVYADPRKEVTSEEFESEVLATLDYIETRSEVIEDWLGERGY
tara:strand:- start:34188 stop:35804 length:1617 start_codon:yes stop_codon:yes gene_type:complete